MKETTKWPAAGKNILRRYELCLSKGFKFCLLELCMRESVIVLLIDFFSAMFSRFMNTGSQFVMEGVKNLVVGNKVS